MRCFLFLSMFLCFAQTALADGLEHRNIPDARLLHEDESGRYYAALMGHGDLHPNDSPIGDVTLRIYVERIPQADGTYVNGVASDAISYPGAPVQEGLNIAEDEIARLNEFVLPKVASVYPEWRSHRNYSSNSNSVMINFYIDGKFFYQGDGGKSASYEAEEPVLWIIFRRPPQGGEWRPAYEEGGYLGHAVSVDMLRVDSVLAWRKPIGGETLAGRSVVLAMFDRHKKRVAELRAKRVEYYIEQFNNARRPGLVYKSGSYWSGFSNFDTPRNVIEGNYGFIAHPADFAEAYLTYVDQYYQRCRSYLPSKRTSYTAEWYETRYGVTSKTSNFYVEMEDRFATHYEKMQNIRHRRSAGAMVTSIFESMAGVDGPNPFSFAGDVLTALATGMVEESEMGRFIASEGCGSAILKQYADNLWRGASGHSPVQATNVSYPGAAQASMPATRADAIWHMNQLTAARARNPKEGTDGYIYHDEEVVAYRTGMGLANDGRGQVEAMRPIGLEIQQQGYPVLYCFYGPTGILKNGEYDTVNFAFWFEKTPKEFDRLKAARSTEKDIYLGLNYARSTCPETSGAARRILRP